MAKWFRFNDKDFSSALTSHLSTKLEMDEEINKRVTSIIHEVQHTGDDALVELTNKFDRRKVNHFKELIITQKQIDAARNEIDSELLASLELAAARIADYHQKQMPQDMDYTDATGVRLGNLWRAIDAVGLYVPGGLASYPSSVLMNAVPAKVAGVKRLVMTVPAPDGVLNPVVLAAASVAGVEEIYTIGGAQAIAALAYGTDTIKPVNTIVGPGNAYVAAAKRQVYGKVGIDMIAGPSEILVIADDSANPKWLAADLLSQAEHDEAARSILLTESESLAKQVEAAIESLIPTLDKKDIARISWENNGAIVIAKDKAHLIALTNEMAAEHLEVATENPEELLPHIQHAGAVFLGHYTPEAIGDYMAGPSHVLPTAGTAAFSSGLSVYDFLKRMSLIGCSKAAFDSLSDATALLADSENLGAHALSVRIRKEDNA